MTQIIATIIAFFAIIGLMGLSLLITGRPMRRSCGGIGGDDGECFICSDGDKPKDCNL